MSQPLLRTLLIGYKASLEEVQSLDLAVEREGLPNRSVLLRKIVNSYLGLPPLKQVGEIDPLAPDALEEESR